MKYCIFCKTKYSRRFKHHFSLLVIYNAYAHSTATWGTSCFLGEIALWDGAGSGLTSESTHASYYVRSLQKNELGCCFRSKCVNENFRRTSRRTDISNHSVEENFCLSFFVQNHWLIKNTDFLDSQKLFSRDHFTVLKE